MPEITEPTREIIDEIITNGSLDRFLGLQETSWFEFREKHYATTSQEPGGSKAKVELAKDCSSIANSGGGYIFIGLKPEIQASQMTEYVSQVIGVTKTDINLISWRDSMKSALTPTFSMENIEHGFIDIDETKSVMWMKIPSANDIGLFPIILHSDHIQREGYRLKGKVIGVYERHGAENEMLSSEKLQGYISKGIAKEGTGEPLSQDLTRIETKLDQLLNERTVKPFIADPELRRNVFIEAANNKIGDEGEGFFYLYALPQTKLEYPNFWSTFSDENSIAHLMKNPPTLRRMGWDLGVAGQEYPTAEPGAWEIKNGDRKMLQVTEGGEVYASGTLRNFLGWGLDAELAQREGFAILINEYALTEYVAMTFRFIKEIASKASNFSDDLKYDIHFGFANLDEYSVGLHRPGMMGIPGNTTSGPMRTPAAWHIDNITIASPDRNTGLLLREITRSGFGGSDDSPYFIDDEGHLTFDETSYQRP